ncbi:MAG: alanine racemase [Candidatus Thiosymbion ectosymbiont of Robbea hypermnestra]|nr:alanine racemase [Candidatus Thiosymbion ectosymbiont of Robbea hypermnestra]
MRVYPQAVIDHSALRHNLGLVRRHTPDSRVWAVVKADAYGHGMVPVATSLAAADGLAVARVEEGVRLREAEIARPILVLEGALFADELAAARGHGLALAVHQPDQVALLAQTPPARPLRVWIKVDTGMHRLGFDPREVPDLLARLDADPGVEKPVGLMTHLANADDVHDPLTPRQCDRLRALDPAARYELSIGNSAGILAFPASRTHWVRPGIMLYGASPLGRRTAAELKLRPVMRLATRLIAVRSLRRGDRVGYGGAYVCPEDMPVGVAAIGYGDGYPRHAPTGTPVLVGGRRASLVGRVSMDMISLDLRGLPESAVGDSVILWGEGLPVDEVAEWAGTIPYELLCQVTPRVRREHRNP